jgi:hypothetical protein
VKANRLRGPLGVVALAFAGLALTAGPAAATFHEISIREVYAGSAAQPGSQYVELQAWSSGQSFLGGHSLKTYAEDGNVAGTATFASMVPNGVNQMTVLLATPAAEAEFGVAADKGLAGTLSPSGGAVCWENLDCVSWGSFGGALPSPAGPPAAAIPDGQALRRTISPGCPTLLEAGDDHDNSAADLSAVFPAPRSNSVAPSERPCARSGGQQSEGPGGGATGRGAPQTTLRRKPAKKTADRTPTFRFGSDEAGSTFQCKVDAKPFRACRSPFTTKQLALGPHTFRVRARDESGKLDPTPASYSFRVVTKK